MKQILQIQIISISLLARLILLRILKLYIIQKQMSEDQKQQLRKQVYFTNKQYIQYYDNYRIGYLSKPDPLQLLIYAKSCFLKSKYQQCIKTLEKIDQNITTKILYQKQTLLFKANYLYNPEDFNVLENIIKDYERNKNRCPGQPLTDFHNNNMRLLISTIIDSRSKSQEIDKQNLHQFLKLEPKRRKFQGFPSYLISTGWNDRLKKYITRDGPHPGPITNFQLMNHIFQFEPHEEDNKKYMDVVLFPVAQEIDYLVITSTNWKHLQELFGGFPVKRVFMSSPKTGIFTGADYLVKTIIQHNKNKIVMQWLSGTHWQKSVLPVLIKKFGIGQLKQQSRNRDFIIVQPGRIEQPYSTLKFVPTDFSIIRAVGQKQMQRKKKIILSFDLQKFNPSQCSKNCSVGLINLKNTCYMNAGLQFLSSLKTFVNYFIENRYLAKINLTETNKDGSYGFVTCAYAELLKRLWFSSSETRYIDPTNFKNVFSDRYTLFEGNQQEDAQEFLMFMLNCLHQDLNQKAQMSLSHRESLGGKAFDTVRNTVVNHYNRHNKSIVSDLFHGFHYEQVICDECQFTSFRFEHYLMLHVQAPPNAPKINVLLVLENDLTSARRFDVYVKNLEKIIDVMQIVRKYFTIKPQHLVIGFLFSTDDQSEWLQVTPDTSISVITKALNNNKYLFFHEVKNPEPDEQIAMIYYSSKTKKELDGYPRFKAIKKVYQQQEYQHQLLQIVYTTIKKQKFQRDRSDYITQKQIKVHKTKDHSKSHKVQYKVYTFQKLNNYDSVTIERILGENDLEDVYTLEGCLQKMCKKQVIEQNQRWHCQRCKCVRKAHKTDKIYSTGNYLIIQIKRFTQKGKITTKVDYPIKNLDVRPYIQQLKIKQAVGLYNLQAVILHRGSLNYGHYTCMCRNADKTGWVYYDDESVRDIEENLVVDPNAYILVYERVDDNLMYSSNVIH